MKVQMIVLCLLFLACAPQKKENFPDPVDTSSLASKTQDLEDFLLAYNSQEGWVVSRDVESKQPRDIGDSALWTGVAVASLDCYDGDIFLKALESTINKRHGMIIRYEPFEENIDNLPDAYSMDGETGIMMGFLVRSLKCPDDFGRLAKLWQKHYDYVKFTGRLHPVAQYAEIPIGLDYVWEGLAWHFGLRGRPHEDGRKSLSIALSGWALANGASERSCYRVHLATLYAIMAKLLKIPLKSTEKRLYCATTDGFKNSLADWYCGRNDALSWLTAYRPGEYYNAHQRCMRWQDADGDPTRLEPPLDYLFLNSLVNLEQK